MSLGKDGKQGSIDDIKLQKIDGLTVRGGFGVKMPRKDQGKNKGAEKGAEE